MSTLGEGEIPVKQICLVIIGATIGAAALRADSLEYKQQFGRELIEGVPAVLKTYDAKTGHLGEGVWICSDQNAIYPLAVAYTLDVPGNPYHKDAALLEKIMKAGDALAADADSQGRWVFRKKDKSTWGMIHMPWTYSRWIRTFSLIRDAMPAERRAAWEKALLLGYTNISKTQLGDVHNIPTHHAMGLYIAGKTLDKPEWCEQAAEFMHRVCAGQSENGYWTEGQGPVVGYNFVYVDAIGTYYAVSKDEAVRPMLQRASAFHRHFTYPDGRSVETIDQRNPFNQSVKEGNVGFTFDPVGRAYLASQWSRCKEHEIDLLASFILYGQEGAMEAGDQTGRPYVLCEDGVDKAMTIRQGPWFVCLSAFTAPVTTNRWHQDRQNVVSIYHDKCGLIVGGGNTKLQPAWSNFTVGDPSLLKHEPSTTQPSFLPKGELYHVPSKAVLVREPIPGLDLTYGPETCRIRVAVKDDRTIEYSLSTTSVGKLPVIGRLTLLPRVGQAVEPAGGGRFVLGEKAVELTPSQVGGSIRYAGCELTLPAAAGLYWPALPHNPYRIDGHADAGEGRIEVRMPFDRANREYRVRLNVQ
jgi:hypothetical protein